jgi:hypothetical protein
VIPALSPDIGIYQSAIMDQSLAVTESEKALAMDGNNPVLGKVLAVAALMEPLHLSEMSCTLVARQFGRTPLTKTHFVTFIKSDNKAFSLSSSCRNPNAPAIVAE